MQIIVALQDSFANLFFLFLRFNMMKIYFFFVVLLAPIIFEGAYFYIASSLGIIPYEHLRRCCSCFYWIFNYFLRKIFNFTKYSYNNISLLLLIGRFLPAAAVSSTAGYAM